MTKPLTPGQAIKQHCKKCVGSTSKVKDCGGDQLLDGTQCLFFSYRTGKGRPSVKKIRPYCLKCMGGSRKLVRECSNSDCDLHPFRMGTNPNRHISKKAPQKNEFNGQFCSEKGRSISGNGVIVEKYKRPFPGGETAF